MRKLIDGKIRNTDKMDVIVGESGNQNDCYSRFHSILIDPRDNKYFNFAGHNWSGLGPDTLEPLKDPLKMIEECGFSLSEDEAERVQNIITS